MAKGPEVYVGLVRAINVGGNNKLPMADLVEIFEEAGASDVRTYIASGNVVFRATLAKAQRMSNATSKAILDRFGFQAPVIIRPAAHVARVARAHPHHAPGIEDKRLHVVFLMVAPGEERVSTLDPTRFPGDAFDVRGGEIYLRLSADSKLTNTYFEKTLGTSGTMRNWRTVLKLAEMSA